MDWITFLKACGEKLPSKRDGYKKWAVWAWNVACDYADKKIFEDKVESYSGISMVLNLGFTGNWKPLPLPKKFRKEAMKYPSIEVFRYLIFA